MCESKRGIIPALFVNTRCVGASTQTNWGTKVIAIQPTIIPRPEHVVSRADISENALKVLYRLRKGGYAAFLVGGCVRDQQLGREPKDFDVATNALPEQVRDLFRNCRLIGRRFRLAHVRYRDEIIEVATFRGSGDNDDGEQITDDNVYGTLEEDALRRDFTINALYYNIDDFSVIDYANGMADLKAGMLQLIGDPAQRYREDPVRMLRAVRFAVKLGFRIHPDSEAPIFELAHLLADIPSARLYEEVLKLFQGGYALQTFEMLRHYGLFAHLFPMTEECLAIEDEGFPLTLVARALANTDKRIAEGKPITPAFLFAALLWDPVRDRAASLRASGMHEMEAMRSAGEQVVSEQVQHVAIPRRFSVQSREIWSMQPRLVSRRRVNALFDHARFRAAYDFLVLRAEAGDAGDAGADAADWWTRYQDADGDLAPPPSTEKAPRRRRRGGRSRAKTGGEANGNVLDNSVEPGNEAP